MKLNSHSSSSKNLNYYSEYLRKSTKTQQGEKKKKNDLEKRKNNLSKFIFFIYFIKTTVIHLPQIILEIIIKK